MTARMPKTHLRLTPNDLLPGEHGLINQFSVQVDEKRRIYVRSNAHFVGIFGANEWPNHRDSGEALIRKREDGKFDLMIRENFSAMPEHVAPDFYKNLIPIQNLVILGTELVECETCKGKGVVKNDKCQG